jgi:hypothetical protein
MNRIITLRPLGRTITITLSPPDANGRCDGGIASDLRSPTEVEMAEDAEDESNYNYVICGVESLVFAQACAGIDVETPAYLEALETVLEAAANEHG